MHVYQGVCYALARERVDVLKDSSIRHVTVAFHKLLSLQMTDDSVLIRVETFNTKYPGSTRYKLDNNHLKFSRSVSTYLLCCLFYELIIHSKIYFIEPKGSFEFNLRFSKGHRISIVINTWE